MEEKKDNLKVGKIKKNKRIILVVVITVIITFLITTVLQLMMGILYIVPFRDYANYKDFKKLTYLKQVIDQNFYKKPNDEDMIEGALKGMFIGTGDVYSAYYTKEEMKFLEEHNEGDYVGIGIQLGEDEKTGFIKVIKTFKNSPAQKAGIKKDDLIVKVEEKPVSFSKSDIAVSMMRGKEGTPVTITIKSGDVVKDVKLVRADIQDSTIEKCEVIDKKSDIGYIKISSFNAHTSKSFSEALEKLQKQNIKGLILDVRDNGGGLLTAVDDVADELLAEEKTIVYTKDNAGNKKYYKSDDNKEINIPIVILTNENSASASEILTGAIKDNKIGISVGTTTYGKGLVQGVGKLSDGSGYKLTIAQYYTPSGEYINEKGIKPTIEVKDKSKQIDIAIDYLSKKIEK